MRVQVEVERPAHRFGPAHLLVGAVAVIGLAAIGPRLLAGGGPKQPPKKDAAAEEVASTVPFARVRGTALVLMLPARPPELIGVGFHQAYNPGSRDLVPLIDWLSADDASEAVRRVKSGWGTSIVMFQMNSRGRGTSKRSAIDVAVRDDVQVVAPASGAVTLVKSYRLYGRYDDLHVEIRPDGHPELRVVAVHLRDLEVAEGDRVVGGKTVLGRARPFGFARQMDRYLGRVAEHVHFQVNPYPPKG